MWPATLRGETGATRSRSSSAQKPCPARFLACNPVRTVRRSSQGWSAGYRSRRWEGMSARIRCCRSPEWISSCVVPCPLSSVPCPLFPIPYSLFPVPCSLFPVPYSLFPIPYSLFPVPCSLFPIPYLSTCRRTYNNGYLRSVSELAGEGRTTADIV